MSVDKLETLVDFIGEITAALALGNNELAIAVARQMHYVLIERGEEVDEKAS